MAKERDRNREEFWRQAAQRRADSGLTIKDFCAREGLKSTAYYYWQREIKRRNGGGQSDTTRRDETPTIAPVELVEADDRNIAAAVEVVAKNGYVVRVTDQATTGHLRRVLQAVSELD